MNGTSRNHARVRTAILTFGLSLALLGLACGVTGDEPQGPGTGGGHRTAGMPAFETSQSDVVPAPGPTPPSPLLPFGAPCTSNAQCSTQLCIQFPARGQRCSAACVNHVCPVANTSCNRFDVCRSYLHTM